MALDREQVGLLFKVSADSTDARRDLELFQGVAEGVALEIRDQFERLGASVNQSMERSTRSLSTFTDQLGDSARGQLAGFLGQFGLLGDAAAGMIPAVSGAGAAVLGFGGLAVGAAAGMQQLIARTTEFTGTIDDLSQVTGLTNESIQSLRLASVLAGQSFESVASTAVIFQRRLQEAREGNEQLRETFNALGIDLESGVDAAFRQTLENLNGMTNGAQKTAVAIDLFGRSGAALLPVMAQVGGEFDALIRRANELGIVLTEEDIKASNDFQDSLDILGLKLEGIANRIGAAVIPRLQQLALAFAFGANAAKTYEEAVISATARQAELGLIARLEGVDTGGNALDRSFAEIARRRREEAAKKETAKETARPGLTAAELNERNIRELEALEKAEQAEQDSLLRREEAYRRYNQAILDGFAKRNQANIDAMEEEDRAAFQQEELRLRSERQIEAYNQRILNGLRQRLEAELDAYADMLNRQEEERLRREAQNPASSLSLFGAAGDEAAQRGAGLFGQLAVSVNDSLGQMSDNLGNFQSIAADAFNNIANGLEQVILTFIRTGQISGKVFKEMAQQIIASVAAQAAVKAIFELAEGFASLALAWVMPSMAGKAAGHFKAAAIYGSVAGIAIAAGAAMSGSVGPGENRFLEGGGARGTRIMEQGREPQVVVIRAETEPGVIVRQVISDYKSNGETRQMLRRDLLAEAF